MSPKIDSPQTIVAITNRLGYGRLGRRASRSLADLNALSSYQQQRGLYRKPRFLLRNIPSGSVEDSNQSGEESESDLLYKPPRLDNVRVKSIMRDDYHSFDK